MSQTHSDALVFFGATGDLAYKKIFPSLQAMVKRGHLNVPVIGVAKSGWTLDQLRARARDSLEKHGGLDPAAFDKLAGLLRYVDGDYKSPATFGRIAQPDRPTTGFSNSFEGSSTWVHSNGGGSSFRKTPPPTNCLAPFGSFKSTPAGRGLVTTVSRIRAGAGEGMADSPQDQDALIGVAAATVRKSTVNAPPRPCHMG
jgi:hypothetical protein